MTRGPGPDLPQHHLSHRDATSGPPGTSCGCPNPRLTLLNAAQDVAQQGGPPLPLSAGTAGRRSRICCGRSRPPALRRRHHSAGVAQPDTVTALRRHRHSALDSPASVADGGGRASSPGEPSAEPRRARSHVAAARRAPAPAVAGGGGGGAAARGAVPGARAAAVPRPHGGVLHGRALGPAGGAAPRRRAGGAAPRRRAAGAGVPPGGGLRRCGGAVG